MDPLITGTPICYESLTSVVLQHALRAMRQHLVTTAFCRVPAITLILVVPGLCLYANFVCYKK